MITEVFSYIAAAEFTGLAVFQLLLALGLPFGKAAWGGRYTRLPGRLRFASLVSAAVLMTSAIVVLERADIVSCFNHATAIMLAVWFLFGYLVLNTIANLASRSRTEKYIMTPVSLIAALSCLVVALTAG